MAKQRAPLARKPDMPGQISLRAALYQKRLIIAAIIAILSAIISVVCLMVADPGPARAMAMLFAAAATVWLIERVYSPRPLGTAIVCFMGIMLPCESSIQAITNGMTQTSFIEAGIGIYLLFATYLLLRK